MAAVPVTLCVTVYPKDKSGEPFPATIVGYAWITGLHPDQSPPGAQPHPEHPIVIVPPQEPGKPPIIWGGGNEPFPTPPIHLPPVEEPPPEGPLDALFTMVAKAPPKDGGWGWFPEYGWVYSPGESGATPKTPRR